MKVQIDVEPELWRDAKSKAALKGMTLGAFVSAALVAMVGPKKIEPVPVPREGERKSFLVMKKCVKCGEETADWVLARDGNVLCQDCAQDLRVANA